MANKTAPINMRVEPSVRDIIDAAANLMKLDRSVFIQQVVLKEAQKILTNQRDFILDEQAFEAFEQALNNDPVKSDGINDLLSRKSPWK
ncbi:DUF1778 domain-containing protein [Thalassotalea sp. LPB0316]|uniref:type II toxin-antitoxin system TacA family antitoxin n=1 Tax=Thalassotalea sp. LPB0316 TaxID=2769490 RepID=UPI0018673A88|nr:DUF1778 domain-containing protein [Thalassotalea sp. LPB0316]QOL26720.1 DUF1778 domain-containing protein [Thalassotalea sp. LPB0316]